MAFVLTGARVFAIGLTLTKLNGKLVIWNVLLLNKKSVVFGALARNVERQVREYEITNTGRWELPPSLYLFLTIQGNG